MDKQELRNLIAAGKFKENNGSVLRTINILHDKYNQVKDIKYALPSLEENEIRDSVNFLHEEGYIHLRDVVSKMPASLADNDFSMLEAKLTGKGIRLLAGGIKDDCIKI